MKKVIMMLAVAAMASCAKSEVETRPVEAGDVEIRVASNAVEVVAGTRVYEGAIAEANKLTAKVLASTTSGQYGGTLYADGTMTFGDSSTAVAFDASVTGSTFYPANGDNVYLFGLYPSDAAWTLETDNSGFTCAIDGKTDIMAAKELTTSKADAPSSYKTFDFYHVLARLDVSVVAETQAAIDAWGEVVGIELTGVATATDSYAQPNNSCKIPANYDPAPDTSVNPAAPKILPTFSGAAAMPFYFYDKDGATTDAKYTTDAISDSKTITLPNKANSEPALQAAYSVIAPFTIQNVKAFELKVTTKKADGTTITKEHVAVELAGEAAALAASSMAGKKYAITLTFQATDIMAKASVHDWVAGESGSVEIN